MHAWWLTNFLLTHIMRCQFLTTKPSQCKSYHSGHPWCQVHAWVAKLLCCWMSWGSFKLAANLLLAFKSLLVCMCLLSCCQNHLLPPSRLDVQFLHATFHLPRCALVSVVFFRCNCCSLRSISLESEAGLDLAGWAKRGRCTNTSKLNVVHQRGNAWLDGPVPAPSKGLATRRVQVVWHKDVTHMLGHR